MQISQGLSYDDVLLVPQEGVLSSRKDANISSEVFDGYDIEIPMISANMPAISGVKMITELRRVGARGSLHRFMTIEQQVEQFKLCPPDTLVSIGYVNGEYAFDALYTAGARNFIFDVAHGHHQAVGAKLERIAGLKGSAKIMAGNVATAVGAAFLEDHGADAIKVGIGPGAACSTRQVTGFGVPQLTAILNIAEISDLPICADGGIKNSGDIVKALAAGASTVMLGSLLAGCDEAPQPGNYYGNASRRVNGHRAPEGVEGVVPLSGPVEDVIKELAWGLRSGISYAGARHLGELRENAVWMQCSPLSAHESSARI